jgi:hypothetical protein
MASEYHVKSWDFSAWRATSLDKDFFHAGLTKTLSGLAKNIKNTMILLGNRHFLEFPYKN